MPKRGLVGRRLHVEKKSRAKLSRKLLLGFGQSVNRSASVIAAAASMLLRIVGRCRRASLELVKVLAAAERCSCTRQGRGPKNTTQPQQLRLRPRVVIARHNHILVWGHGCSALLVRERLHCHR